MDIYAFAKSMITTLKTTHNLLKHCTMYATFIHFVKPMNITTRVLLEGKK